MLISITLRYYTTEIYKKKSLSTKEPTHNTVQNEHENDKQTSTQYT